MAMSDAEKQKVKRDRDQRKLKSFTQFMEEIGEMYKLEAGKIVADLSETLKTDVLITTALLKECFDLEASSISQLCEAVVRFNKDRRLQSKWWEFLRELQRFNDENINRIIDKRAKELKK